MSLERVLSFNLELPEEFAKSILRRLAAGISGVHGRGFMHRDIKPANVLLVISPDVLQPRLAIGLDDEDAQKCFFKEFCNGSRTEEEFEDKNGNIEVVIADFGCLKSSKKEDNEAPQTRNVSDHFTAPEVSNRETYNESIDIYSLGAVMLEIVFTAKRCRETYRKLCATAKSVNYADVLKKLREELQDRATDAFWDLLAKTITIPTSRLSIEEFCGHEWFRDPGKDSHGHPLEDPKLKQWKVSKEHLQKARMKELEHENKALRDELQRKDDQHRQEVERLKARLRQSRSVEETLDLKSEGAPVSVSLKGVRSADLHRALDDAATGKPELLQLKMDTNFFGAHETVENGETKCVLCKGTYDFWGRSKGNVPKNRTVIMPDSRRVCTKCRPRVFVINDDGDYKGLYVKQCGGCNVIYSFASFPKYNSNCKFICAKRSEDQKRKGKKEGSNSQVS